ncbi:MAG: methyltransferase domain-containing protein [Candidatus Gracilibacteria bacterium]|jgi:23S rRNA (guanine745-N1)-methyltransferase
MESIYLCPVCKQQLEQVNKSFICSQKHTYDISREGYVNFLLANQKKTKDPGDSKLMVDGRQFFLDQGYYDPLAKEINKIILPLVKKSKTKNFNILDVGCGTGFYSGKLQESLKLGTQAQHSTRASKPSAPSAHLWGIDISKPAIQKAAKKYPDIHFSIGSNFHLPYLNESLDLIFSIFSPFDSKELFRVLKPGGKILLIRPAHNHLKELATLIYDKFQLQGNPLDLSESLGLSLLEKYQLGFEIHLKNNEDIMNLVSMTPYHWHLNEEKKALLAKTREFTTGTDFQISLYQKKSA